MNCPNQDVCLHLKASAGIYTNLDGEYGRIPMDICKISRLAQSGKPLLANDLPQDENFTNKAWIQQNHVSHRRSMPRVQVNCAALSPTLIESELFGHEKGPFTGAISRKIGRFKLADGGTIFLDEIGSLPFELRGKLLRVLQEGELEPLGSEQTQNVDVRVIAATNQDLEALMKSNRFREDLYYRLNVSPITCPPLRKRREDIPLLGNELQRSGW